MDIRMINSWAQPRAYTGDWEYDENLVAGTTNHLLAMASMHGGTFAPLCSVLTPALPSRIFFACPRSLEEERMRKRPATGGINFPLLRRRKTESQFLC
ncbi:hypothetical protein L249_0172 [Ophiocordyceps polyrhachis-furcata BCC 54312]|uniref:Uncharacterized protein n=1 Tax=Ophiocordyceps polyrhachis-furcata BCC 54312 TaxID=1330021 RepID=A0A367LDJ2_9HYPO|nr:hypothetical protein L249_0172 [Ophiocordyceps polyrhachis-furcata BCC 54312]